MLFTTLLKKDEVKKFAKPLLLEFYCKDEDKKEVQQFLDGKIGEFRCEHVDGKKDY
ncbi:MAG: hypothetical protein ACTSQU_00415 [Promethearchaeota archaeon]